MSLKQLLSDPQILFDSGHTLSLVKFNNLFHGYLGHVHFERVSVLTGPSIYDLANETSLLNDARWGSAIKINGEIRLYFTRQGFKSKLPFINPFEEQTIYYVESDDGVTFGKPVKVTEGSAPFPFWDNDELCLVFHRRKPQHQILLLRDRKMGTILKSSNPVSAPSVVKFDGLYHLTCEYRISRKAIWNTVLYEGKALDDMTLADSRFLEGPCAFQHLFERRYVVTYSVPVPHGPKWQVLVREAKL